VKTTSLPIFLSLAMLLSATQASAQQSSCVLTISGVPGESTAVPNGIDLFAFSWGLQNTPRTGEGGGAISRPQFNEFSITKRLDKSSPLLMLGSAQGTHYANATISCRKVSADRAQEYLRYTLSDVLVASYQSSASNEVPTDSISFNFSRVEFTYRPQNPDGSLGPPVTVCFDVRIGRSCT